MRSRAAPRHECARADRRAAVQSLDTITIAATKTEERAIDALAPVSVVTLEQIQGLQPNRLSRYLLQCPGRLVPGSRRRSVDRRSTFAACRISAASPSWSMARGRTISAPATTPTARSSSIPSWSAASTSCAARPPTSTAPARSAAWSRSAPRTSRTCVRPGERWGVDMTGFYGSNKARGFGSVFGGVRVNPRCRRVRRRGLSHAGQLQGRQRHRDRQHRQRGRRRPDEAHGAARRTATRSSSAACSRIRIHDRPAQSRARPRRRAARAIAGSSVYASDAKNYTGTINWKYSQAGRHAVRLECDVLRQPHRERPDQDLQ